MQKYFKVKMCKKFIQYIKIQLFMVTSHMFYIKITIILKAAGGISLQLLLYKLFNISL